MRPKFVTFDCYGTLINFELDAATRQVLGPMLDAVDTDDFFREFRDLRFRTVLEEYRPYHEVLSRSLETVMGHFDLEYTDDYGAAIVASVPNFGPYPEVPPALERIRRRSKI